MVKEFLVTLNGERTTVIVSEEEAVLQAAKAAGRAVLGIWDREHPEEAPFGAEYLVERSVVEQAEAEAAAACVPLAESKRTGPDAGEFQTLLERVVRRHKNLPWILAETERLVLREMIPEDWALLKEELAHFDPDFLDQEFFLAYLRSQYRFYEYGLWAVVKKSGSAEVHTVTAGDCAEGENQIEEAVTGVAGEPVFTDTLIGAAGFWNFEGIAKNRQAAASVPEVVEALAYELGYLILPEFRRQGYGLEAVRAVLELAVQEAEEVPIYAKIREDNVPSRILIERAGMKLLFQASNPDTDIQTRPALCLYGYCC